MLIQITKDCFVNTEQINYVSGFEDLGERKEKTYIRFKDKDTICLPISIEEFTEVIKKYAEG